MSNRYSVIVGGEKKGQFVEVNAESFYDEGSMVVFVDSSGKRVAAFSTQIPLVVLDETVTRVV